MKLTINSKVLEKYNLTFGEFLVMLIGYFGTDYDEFYDRLVKKGFVEPNVFKKCSVVLSDNSKNMVAEILMSSDDKAINSGIDFESVAKAMQMAYPDGKKAGTTYDWRGNTAEIAQKLRTLVVKHNFIFTEKEAIAAVREYVNSYKPPYADMRLLKYFILKTAYSNGNIEVNSDFMTIIENNRAKNETDN